MAAPTQPPPQTFGPTRNPELVIKAVRPAPTPCSNCGSVDHRTCQLFDGMLWLDGGRLVRWPTPAERAAIADRAAS